MPQDNLNLHIPIVIQSRLWDNGYVEELKQAIREAYDRGSYYYAERLLRIYKELLL